MFRIKKAIALAMIIATVFSSQLSVIAKDYPSLNMDTKHPLEFEMEYVDGDTGAITKNEKITSYVMNYCPVPLRTWRTVTSAYIYVDVWDCSLMTTVQISESRDFSRARTLTVTNKQYKGVVLTEYHRVEDYVNKRITFTRVLTRYDYGAHNLSYRKIDITANPKQTLVTTEAVANSIKPKISNKKTIRITGLDPKKRYYFRLKNLYEGFGYSNIKYPRRVGSTTTTVTVAPLK